MPLPLAAAREGEREGPKNTSNFDTVEHAAKEARIVAALGEESIGTYHQMLDMFTHVCLYNTN